MNNLYIEMPTTIKVKKELFQHLGERKVQEIIREVFINHNMIDKIEIALIQEDYFRNH